MVRTPATYYWAGRYVIGTQSESMSPYTVNDFERLVFVFDSTGREMPPVDAAQAPPDLHATTLFDGNVTLAWTNATTDISHYQLQRAIASGQFVGIGSALAGSATTVTDHTAALGNSYRYRLNAFNGRGDSAYSNVITVTPSAAPTISRTATGLLFKDDFNRADGSPGANWVIESGSWAIVGNKLQATITRNVATWVRIASTALPDRQNIHAQLTIARSNLQTYLQTIIRRTPDHLNFYTYDARASDDGTDPNGTATYRFTNGGYARLAGGAHTVTYAAGVSYRVNPSMIGTSQRGWINGTLGALVSGDATAANQSNGGVALETYGQPAGPTSATATIDDVIICSSSTVTITGLPSGYKLRVAGIVSAAATGGAAVSVDLLGTQLPVAQIEILDSANTVVKVYAPADGVWGGDQYTYATP
jgi:hypothetical protein